MAVRPAAAPATIADAQAAVDAWVEQYNTGREQQQTFGLL
jgi:hypothetical protein